MNEVRILQDKTDELEKSVLVSAFSRYNSLAHWVGQLINPAQLGILLIGHPATSNSKFPTKNKILTTCLLETFSLTSMLETKVGAILKNSIDWSDTDVILPGESIDKAIVSLQIPEVLNDEAIQVLSCKKFELAKRLCRFKPQNF
jgi:hypothetical protein